MGCDVVMVMDTFDFRRRTDVVKKLCGVRDYKDSWEHRNSLDVFDIYYNPSTWRWTGIMDNERNKFYKNNQNDMIEFVRMLNRKELEASGFLQGIEATFKDYMNKQLRFLEVVDEMSDRIKELEEENRMLKEKYDVEVAENED